jgi:hypothetical protein
VGRTESFTGARTKKEKDKRKRLRFKVKKSDQLLPQWVLKVYRKEPAGQMILATDNYWYGKMLFENKKRLTNAKFYLTVDGLS